MKINPAPFKSWLKLRNYSASTIKNYLADLRKFQDFIAINNPRANNPFSSTLISNYLSSLTDKSNYKRYLASLNKFCQFAIDQRVISTNPVTKALNPTTPKSIKPHQQQITQLLNQFSLYLKKHHKSSSTVKNYLVDIHQFLNWLT